MFYKLRISCLLLFRHFMLYEFDKLLGLIFNLRVVSFIYHFFHKSRGVSVINVCICSYTDDCRDTTPVWEAVASASVI